MKYARWIVRLIRVRLGLSALPLLTESENAVSEKPFSDRNERGPAPGSPSKRTLSEELHAWADLIESGEDCPTAWQAHSLFLRAAKELFVVPDLLAALQRIVTTSDDGPWTRRDVAILKDQVRAAIARATGREEGQGS